jgi:hypothetical protein
VVSFVRYAAFARAQVFELLAVDWFEARPRQNQQVALWQVWPAPQRICNVWMRRLIFPRVRVTSQGADLQHMAGEGSGSSTSAFLLKVERTLGIMAL